MKEDMPYLFDHFDSVRKLLSLAPFGLFTDVDGTISEIAPSPAEARVSPICRQSLAVLAKHLAVVVAISGRPAAEAREMVGIDEMVYIGNHGYERWVGGVVELVPGVGDYPAGIKAVLDELRKLISIEGIILENKGPTASIHYRRCRDREAALKAIISAVGGLARASDLRVSLGKMAVELRPPLEVSKGTAVFSLIREHYLSGAIYLGDDLTDVDVFVAFHQKGLPFKGLAIGVIGEETVPQVARQADFTVNGVGDVERFLRQVVVEVVGRPAP
ncbi:MAG: trehalose-phosphatase [Dehalococcoidia bacterium]|nr:MAG: trehalose-phosphatase [Dehalococcoidia bacterium]